MGSTPDGRLANDRIAAKEREIRVELPRHVAEEHVLYRVLEQLAPSLTETEADVLAHRLAHLPAVAVYLGGPEMSLLAIRTVCRVLAQAP
jgi:hypothetical protein